MTAVALLMGQKARVKGGQHDPNLVRIVEALGCICELLPHHRASLAGSRCPGDHRAAAYVCAMSDSRRNGRPHGDPAALRLGGPVSIPEPASPSWDEAYARDAPAPWDIGRPQAAFVRLADSGLLRGRVLDSGCRTGEDGLLAAAPGAAALAIHLP